MKVAVIGSGIAGLAVAIRLKNAGHTVHIYEKNEQLGGKMSQLKKGGFTWDGGPSFFTDPDEFMRLFSDSGKDPYKYFNYIKLDEACRYFYDGVALKGYADPSLLASEFESVLSEPSINVKKFLKDAQAIYTNTAGLYLDKPFSIGRIFSIDLLRAITSMPIAPIFRSMHANHKSYFITPEAIKFFDRFATYIGSDPTKAPGLLSCMPHLEHGIGAFQPVGGMHSIIRATAKLANDVGVVIHTRTPVEGLGIKENKVTGINSNGKLMKFDLIVNGADVANIMNWHDKPSLKTHQKKEHSSSALVLYLGVKKSSLKLHLHNIFFSDNYDEETSSFWNTEVPYFDPTIYINVTSILEESHAPKGHQNWFVMVNIPAGSDSLYVSMARKHVLDKLSRIVGYDINNDIVCEQVSLTPSYIETKYGAYKGSIYGLAGNSWKGAFFRPPNKDRNIKGLYHCGVTSHPGGGIPLALRSARIVAEMIG